jgi:GDP-D-mannose 3', 5'-epimerase
LWLKARFAAPRVDETLRLAESGVREPLNLGSDELVSINELVSMVEDIAGVKLKRNYKLDAPRGVRGRNSDNTKIKKELGWAPSINLRDGMAKTYAWIRDELTASGAIEERRKLFAT